MENKDEVIDQIARSIVSASHHTVEYEDALKEAREVYDVGKKLVEFRHKKRLTTYNIIGDAELQCSSPVEEGDKLIVYRCKETGKLWARPQSEFFDGRFERKICSYCSLACMPIWSSNPKDHCEICDEV